MDKIEKNILDFCQDVLKEIRGEKIDNAKFQKAQDWYKKFTGKEYTGNPRDLVEMYDIVEETC